MPLFKSDLNDGFGLSDIKEVYKNKYTGPIVTYCDDLSENGFISAGLLSGKDSMIVSVFGICIFRVFWIFCIFSQEAYHTIETIYYSYI